jgi:hypothetical protein
MSLLVLLTEHGPPPDLVSVNFVENGDGDLCGAGGPVHGTIGWVVVGAPDAQYQIDIDGVATGLAPSAGSHVFDTGFGPVSRSQGTFTENQVLGPYTVRLIRTAGAVEIENQATGTDTVNYSTELCA